MRTNVRPARGFTRETSDEKVCGIRVDGATSRTIDVTYTSLPGNQPKTYKNILAVWESTVVPWSVKPEREMRLSRDAASGMQTITDIEVTRSAYTIAYCAGRDTTDACASATLAESVGEPLPSSVSITVDQVANDSLTLYYRTLYGYLPKTYKNWVGLWPGLASPYNAPRPLARAEPTDASEGRLTMTGLELVADTVYTLVYFMGARQTTAAAISTFRTTG